MLYNGRRQLLTLGAAGAGSTIRGRAVRAWESEESRLGNHFKASQQRPDSQLRVEPHALVSLLDNVLASLA